MSEIVQQFHECKWSNQHLAVNIIGIKDHEAPWTLRVYMDRLIGASEEDEGEEFNIDIDYCPFCGIKL